MVFIIIIIMIIIIIIIQFFSEGGVTSAHRLRGSWQRAYAFGVINLQRHSYCILAETSRPPKDKIRFSSYVLWWWNLNVLEIIISVCRWWSMLIWKRMRISSPLLGAQSLIWRRRVHGPEQGVASGSWVLNRLYYLAPWTGCLYGPVALKRLWRLVMNGLRVVPTTFLRIISIHDVTLWKIS